MVNVDAQPDEQRSIARQLNDLTAVLALPAMWKGRNPAFIAESMLDILGSLLRLDVAYAGLTLPPEGCPALDLLWPRVPASPEGLLAYLHDGAQSDEAVAVTVLPDPTAGAPLRLATLQRDLLGAAWRIAVGSQRPDFPTTHERFLVNVTVEQAAIAIETAVLLGREQAGRRAAQEQAEIQAQLSAALRESEQHYRTLFETAAVSIWEEDFSAVTALVDELRARGISDLGVYFDEHPEVVNEAIERIRILDVNAQTLAMFDAASKEELLASLGTIFVPETAPVFRDELVAIAEGRRTFVAEAPLRTLRGDRRDVLVTIAFPEPCSRFDRVPVTLTDITERKRAEEERQRLEREKDAFLATASHDLKNPLASIKGNAQLLRRHVSRGQIDPSRLAVGLGSIDSAVSQMVGLIDALLDLTRLRMGRPLDLETQPTDLVALAHRVASEQQATTERHRIVVEAAETEVVGAWDVRRLERVLGNLLSNAIKYSPHGGPITVTVAREAQAEGLWAVLTVHDRGLGIPAPDLPRIFEHFHRAANVTGSITGTGIGLAGARQIVEHHGGTITVESRQGEGSTFIVRLPLAAVAESPPILVEPPPSAVTEMREERIREH